MQVSKFDITCPPWALPKEEFPLYVKIAKDLVPNIRDIRVDLPDCLEMLDTINILDYQTDGHVTISEIDKSAHGDYDYFGIVLATTEPFEELKKEVPVSIRFEYRDRTHEIHTIHARIFRPRIEFDGVPEPIALTDSSSNLRLPIGIKLSGFGEISLRAECLIEGEIVSVGTSLLDELVRRMLNGSKSTNAETDGLNISPEYVKNITEQLKEMLETDADIHDLINRGRASKEILDVLRQLSVDDKIGTVEAAYRSVGVYLTQIIADIIHRNPSYNSQLESQTEIRASIKLPTTRVTVKFFYRDKNMNEYEPIETAVEIVDKRRNPTVMDIDIPLDVAVDESATYKNVGEIAVGSK